MGSYDGDIVLLKPMISLSFMTGDVENEYAQTGTEYMGHTKTSLTETCRTTVSFIGLALQWNKEKTKKSKGKYFLK